MCFYGIFKDDTKVYYFQESKQPNPKKIQAIVQMLIPMNPQQI